MINQFLKDLTDVIQKDTEIFEEIKKGEQFEKYVIKKMETMENPLFKNIQIEYNGEHSFPDVKVTFSKDEVYGIEIKFSASGNWKSKGNSVFESLSHKGAGSYKEIYVLFGRKPKSKEKIELFQVKVAPYGSSIDKLEVTHSPRFSINMNEEGYDLRSLFGDKANYANFRVKSNEEKNKLLKNYFKEMYKDDPSSKWYLPSEEIEIEQYNSPPILFSSLKHSIKEKIIAESFILFPYDLLKNQANYENVAFNMINEYFVYSTSLRDNFSANGREKFSEDNKFEYPRILKTFQNSSATIENILKSPSTNGFEDKCYSIWQNTLSEEQLKSFEFSKEKKIEEQFKKILETYKPSFRVKNLDTSEEEKIDITLKNFYLT